MLTILLSEEIEHPEWKLFDSFFYHAEGSRRLIHLRYKLENGFIESYQAINQTLSEVYDDSWQLIVLLPMSKFPSFSFRLTNQLKRFKKELLNPLKSREAGPEMVTVLLLDSISRSMESSNTIEEMCLSLDMQGFCETNKLVTTKTNIWTSEDFNRLDHAWGDQIDLKDIGYLQKPNSQFLKVLEEKRDAVIATFQSIVNEKQEMAKELDQTHNYLDIYSMENIENLKRVFIHKLMEITTPPLQEYLSTFQPSQILKKSLKDVFSLKSITESLKIIRFEVSAYSKRKRYDQWLQLVSFLTTIIDEPSILRHIPSRKVFYLKIDKDEKLQKHMLQSYKAVLEGAIYYIENNILNREKIITTKFDDTNEKPYAAGELEKLSFEIPKFKGENKQSYFRKWYSFAQKVKDHLQVREQKMKEEARNAIQKIKVMQRKDLIEQAEKVEIYEYENDLKLKEEELLIMMSKHTPPPLSEQEDWETFSEEMEFKVDHQLKKYPSKNMVVVTGLLIYVSLIAPVFFTMEEFPKISEWYLWIYPVVTLFAIAGISFLGIKRITAPINDYVNDTERKKDELLNRQYLAHTETNHYLNAFYELDRVQKKRIKIEKELEKEQRLNQLYRYHLNEANVALDAFNHLTNYLHVESMENDEEKILSYIRGRFNPALSMEENVIYSPIVTGEIDLRDTHSTEYFVEEKKIDLQAKRLRLLKKIKLEKDQVYE